MTDILDLPDWELLARRQEGDEYELEAEYRLLPGACTKCGSVGRLYKHGTKDTTFRDSPIRGHPVRLLARVQRFRCRDCGETFLQPLGAIQEAMRMTERCAEYVKGQCLRDTFARIAEHVGCDEKTIRTLASEHILALEANYRPELPRQLGMDETKIDGRQRCVITDIGRKRPIELLADRDKVTVAGWLARFPDRSGVEVVAIDMWRPYLDVAHVLFPGVPVVVDKFHVVRMANKCLDDTRKRLRTDMTTADRRKLMRDRHIILKREKDLDVMDHAAMEVWTGMLPELYYGYQAKERFFGVYDAPDRKEGQERYDSWLGSLDMLTRVNFKELITACENWKPEILNYFGTGATNAYTEAANGLAKIANRSGRGYSFEAIRAKIIYGGSVKRGKFGESPVDEEIFAEMTRPVVETPQADAEKETEGGQ